MLRLETILNYRLDSLCFGVFLMTVAIAVQGRLRRRHGSGLTLPVWCTMAALMVVGTIVPEIAGERERSRLRAMLSGIAPTYAQELELLGHDRLSFDTSPDDPRYLAMIEAQIRWEKINQVAVGLKDTGEGLGPCFTTRRTRTSSSTPTTTKTTR